MVDFKALLRDSVMEKKVMKAVRSGHNSLEAIEQWVYEAEATPDQYKEVSRVLGRLERLNWIVWDETHSVWRPSLGYLRGGWMGAAEELMDSNAAERRELIQHMLKELEMPKKKLTQWELEFVESVSDQFDRKRDLSDKQFDTLERIYTEKTA